MPAPATRTWRFFGDVFSDAPSIDVTITFNDVVVYDGEISSDYSYYDYQNNWDKIITTKTKHKLFCQTELAYSTTGLIPLKITVNSDGVLNYAQTVCNYTSSTYSFIEPSIDFGSSCDPVVDNKRSVQINQSFMDIAPLGHSYRITKESRFQCEIFMDPTFSSWIPASFAMRLKESLRTRF